MQSQLEQIKKEARQKLAEIKSQEALKKFEVEFLGRRGKLNTLLRKLSELSLEQRRKIGQAANKLKQELVGEIKRLEESFLSQQSFDFVDVTLPPKPLPLGHEHPITQVTNQLVNIFISMGFKVLEGPELESDFYTFEALNIPSWHPARDMQDTFYIDKKNDQGQLDLVMRTHTSPMQVRAMRRFGAPLRCIVPGRVFRSEATDACHEHTFYQMEGLMIDKNINLVNLIAVMKELIYSMFDKQTKVRIRPGYFPFVEPGIELDIQCTICGGKGCASCKHSGWLELLPAGMVHPKVLEYGGIDSEKFSGFAFGLGLTRLAMMKYGIEDIRLFASGDIRFLEQF
jgi:phenylalanyl-tRNA synthetase alpha chain